MELADLITLFSETPEYVPLKKRLVPRPKVSVPELTPIPKNQINDTKEAQNTNVPLLPRESNSWNDKAYKNAILDAQIWTESRGNPNAVGPMTSYGDRAVGLTQFMPKTWEWAKDMGWIDPAAKRTNPQASLKAQEKFMDYLYNRPYMKKQTDEKERIAMTLAAYNAGYGRLRKAIRTAESENGNWFDYMPAETRKYIPIITEHKYLKDGTYTPKYNRNNKY